MLRSSSTTRMVEPLISRASPAQLAPRQIAIVERHLAPPSRDHRLAPDDPEQQGEDNQKERKHKESGHRSIPGCASFVTKRLNRVQPSRSRSRVNAEEEAHGGRHTKSKYD